MEFFPFYTHTHEHWGKWHAMRTGIAPQLCSKCMQLFTAPFAPINFVLMQITIKSIGFGINSILRLKILSIGTKVCICMTRNKIN